MRSFHLPNTHGGYRQLFGVLRLEESADVCNIAPSQAFPVVGQNGLSRELTLMRWDYLRWASDPKIGLRTIKRARGDGGDETRLPRRL